MTLAVGLMSGTSADGVTAALVDVGPRQIKVLRCKTFPYSPALRRRVLAAASLKTPELSLLNVELGEAFAKAALKIMAGKRPLVIGSHGQTVWHGPDAAFPNTLQLGEPSVIAERAGLPVVADFRPRDMAAGGQGAPLVPAFDEFLFQGGPPRAVVNIGGIANVSIVGNGKLRSAFDTGPGNGLMDLAMRIATKGRAEMDRNGALAAKGQIDCGILRKMLADPYFKRKAPKSLDKDVFGEAFLKRHLGKPSRARLPGMLATLNALTACSLADALPRGLSEVVVSGGGALNKTLMRNLATLVSPAPVATTQRYGMPVMAKEAACFAWLAVRAWQGKTNNCPQATGARGRRVLGKIIPV